MQYFLAKTEEHEYGIDDLARDKEGPWTGVNNPQAKGFLRSMREGDVVFIYHTGKVKAIVGEAVVSKTGDIPHFRFKEKFAEPFVTLAQVKAQSQFADLRLVRQSRLSVMDLPDAFVSWLTAHIKRI
ncbi:EVE domain-containing protein [Candidatus Woesebacteria bacterium]|nr:EVE domain-containing protein [Candidatus Woesebacteria bacterium]MBP9687449.1 EVE domain-containing protein [Candidatus Woesebacteria bacterium]